MLEELKSMKDSLNQLKEQGIENTAIHDGAMIFKMTKNKPYHLVVNDKVYWNFNILY